MPKGGGGGGLDTIVGGIGGGGGGLDTIVGGIGSGKLKLGGSSAFNPTRSSLEKRLRIKEIPYAPNTGGAYDEILSALEGILSPVEGSSFGSRLEGDLTRTRNSVLAGDPALKAYYDQITSGLDTSGPNGLPADFANTLTEGVRSSQAARGVLDSGTSGLQEAVALMGGREQILGQRIARANQLLTSGLLPSMSDFMPKSGDLLSTLLGLEQLQLQRGLGTSQLRLGGTEAQRKGWESIGSSLSSIGSG